MISFSHLTLSDWGDIGNVILGVASVFTAVVTAVVLCRQHNLQKKQYELEKEKLNVQQIEHQPVFEFRKQNDQMLISNVGTEVIGPIRFTITSMITIQIIKDILIGTPRNCIYCYPVLYYKNSYPTGNLKGCVGCARYDRGELELLEHKVNEIKNKMIPDSSKFSKGNINPVYSVKLSDVIQITYTDRYNIHRVLHFWDGKRISQQRFSQLVTLSRSVPSDSYGAQDINPAEIISNGYATTIELKA